MKINDILVDNKIFGLIEVALQVYFVNLFSGSINNTKKELVKEEKSEAKETKKEKSKKESCNEKAQDEKQEKINDLVKKVKAALVK